MTTKIFSALAGLILLFAVAAPLQAGSILNHEMTVIVPFEFVAGDRVLADGDYTVQINIERGSVVLRGEGQRVLILPHHQEGITHPPSTRQACLPTVRH